MNFSERTIKDYNDFVQNASDYLMFEDAKKLLVASIEALQWELRSTTSIANGKSKATKAQRAKAFLMVGIIGTELIKKEHLLAEAKQSSSACFKQAHVSHDYLAMREEPTKTGQITVLLPHCYRRGNKVVAPYYGDNDNPRIASYTRHIVACKGTALIFGDLLPGRDWQY